MATKTVSIGSSGERTYSANTTLVSASSSSQYRITAFSLDWNDNGAYIESNGTNQFTIKLVIGTTTITIGTYSRSNATGSTGYGARPTISWSGSILAPGNAAIKYVQAQVDSSKPAGIMNVFNVTVTYTAVSKPSVTEGSVITDEQMKALQAWLGKGTSTSAGTVITATVGNSYRSSSVTSGTTVIEDTWYNT